MPVTGLRGRQILDGDVTRADVNTSTSGSALITKLIAGTNITITSTGVDAGTGDVTINATGGSSLNGTGFVRMSGTTASYITGTSSQFVKADGSLDSSSYYLSSGGILTGNPIIHPGSNASYGAGVKFRNEGYAHYSIGVKGSNLVIGNTGSDGQSVWPAGTVDLITITTAGNLVTIGTITATSVIRSGGTSSQFLKADGSVDSSTYLTGNQTITLSGDATGSGTTAITVTLANSGVTAGTYRSVTVDAKGRVTGGTNPTTLSGYGITDALSNSTTSTQSGYFGDIFLFDDSTPSHYLAITNSANLTAARTLSINVNDADRTISLSGNLTVSAAATVSGTNTGDQTITLTGDVTGSGTGSFAATLANSGVTAGTYNNVTVNAKGLVTGGSNVSYLTSYTETDTLATVTGRGATTSTLSNFNGGINMTGATSSTGLNITSSSASGGGSVIRITKTAAANQAYITFDTDQLFFGTPSNNTTDADVGTKGSVNLRLQTNYTTRINIGPTGTIRLVPLTSNGFLKTSGGDGTLTVDTATYLTAESDTLATVTGRGATTSTAVTFSGGVTIGGQGTGTGIIGNAGFTSNYTGISLNGTLSTSSYNILSSPTETTLYINRPTGAAIRFREANGSDQMVIATGGAVTFSSTITASSLIRSGGTSSQFLKADGSVDSNTYITSASVGNGTLTLAVSGTGLSGSASFTANQSGNTTFTVTSNATSANTASAIVARDASGNFSAGAITSSALYGTSYSTLTSGAGTGTAVFDTITTSGNRLYRVIISGNPNAAGSGSYLDWIYGKLIIGGGYDGTNVVNYIEFVQESPMPRTLFGSGGGDLTVDVKFVQSNVEYDSIGIGGTYTVRFKISGYNSTNTGASTTINLLQIG